LPNGHLNKKWNSLSDLKEFFDRNKQETVLYYDGMILKTNKGNYGLSFGQLSFEKKNNA